MSGRKRVWVLPDGEGGWNVKTEGAKRAVANFKDKVNAIDKAKSIAKKCSQRPNNYSEGGWYNSD